MKNLLSLSLSLFMAAMMFSSCDDLTTIDIPFNLQTEHDLAVKGNDLTVNLVDSIDLTTNDQFNDNKSKLDAVGIDSVQFRITDNTSLSKTQTLQGNLFVANLDGSNEILLHAITTPINISATQTATADGSWITIALNQEGKDRLSSLIKNDPHSARFILRGTTNEAPSDFAVHFKIWWAMNATTELI
jgi:hypothetical protein